MRIADVVIGPAMICAFCCGVGVAGGGEPVGPTAPASEANPSVPAAGHSLHGEAFDDGPRQAARLMPGMGNVRFPVTTARPEAQAFVDQGVAQLHSFFYFEAERSFRQALKLDPGCAMAYWGMAMSNVNNSRRAREFLKQARKLGTRLTRRERLYLDALEPLHKEGEADKARKQKHLDGLGALVHEFPDDVHALSWLAMVDWQNGNTTSRDTVDFLLTSVLRADPRHPGANHYRIHLWDGNTPAKAETSAAVYGQTAPGIAHAWHMPGHTYTGLQRYGDAAYQQEASARVDHAYMTRDRVMPFEIHNYAHNNQWLVTSLSHTGRVRDAVAVARNLVEQPRDPSRNGKNDGGSAQRNGRLRWSEVLTRYELWDDLITATDSGAIDWSDLPAERKQKAYTLGLAYAAKGDPAGLAAQVAALKALKTTPDVTAAQAELEGYQLLAKREFIPAFEKFSRATGMRAESLARAHVLARNYGFAENAAKDAVTKQPNQVPPLAAQVEILETLGRTEEARAAYRKLAPLARSADPDLPVFQRLAPILAKWRAENSWSENPEVVAPEAVADRPELSTLGPLVWSPFPAEDLTGQDTKGEDWRLSDHKGRNVVVLFYLGGKCAHCMQQLALFGKEAANLKAADTDLVAVSTDDPDATRLLKENKDGVKFPMPLLSDPGLDAFKRYRAYNDFEGEPLHAIVLIDAGGFVRYQRVSSEPFLDVDFIKTEASRLNTLTKNRR